MSDAYVGEIRQVAFDFAPPNWALCQGQLVPIRQYTALFSIIGTFYGGNGTSTFQLPNLSGRFAIGVGPGQGFQLSRRDLGESDGASTVTLISSEMPIHSHSALAVSAPGDAEAPTDAVWSKARTGRVAEKGYTTTGADRSMFPLALAPAGGGQPHQNMPPYVGVNYMICLVGEWPERP